MAYYHTASRHIADYYAQGLFTATTSWTHDFEPYTDSYQAYNHNHEHSPSRSRRDVLSSPPPSSSPPRSSPPPQCPNPHPEPSSSSPPAPQKRPPPRPPSPAHPSPSYLEFASKPSETLYEPTRKLLVLDLNGTLLLRSPRIPKSFRGQHKYQHPAPRRVHPRPYLTALRAYMFAPQTRAWLDVMVWSSAQPHSVEDMVRHAFGNDRDQLVAIWARDSLGLAEDLYHRKVQTIKDLETPWAALTPHVPSPKPKSDRQPSPETQPQTWTGHSAATTILLDDSHAKAARQPHNHLCVLEYTRAQRHCDLAALKPPSARSAPREPDDAASKQPAPLLEGNTEKRRKRKRKREKEELELEQQHEPTSPAAPLPGSPTNDSHADSTAAATTAPAPEPALLDETLLAVIGILHTARLQSSIAGWIRDGALQSESGAVWCEDPALMHAWAIRGREAMKELGLEIKHGVVPDP